MQFRVYNSTTNDRTKTAQRLLVRVCALLFVLGVFGVKDAYAGLTITPVSWNVIGLDSNNPSVGPDTYQIGARVCNTGGTAVSNVVGTFVWDSSNAFINLGGNNPVTFTSLNAGACTDFYFPVTITRTSLAYNATRGYHITASATGVSTVSTPTPRELYVEKIISQNRNSVNSISGPTTVFVGQTYQYTVNASTATQGYEQLEAFLNLSNVIFQVLSIATTYTAPAGATNDKFYADACGWDNNPLSANYRSCIGPANYSGGKAGGTVSTTYTVKILSAGTTTASTLINDFSGSSYHYNNDYGVGINSITITAVPESADLQMTKTATSGFQYDQNSAKTATYSLSVKNNGPQSASGTITVSDTLPAGLTYVSGIGTGWSCSAAGSVVTCTNAGPVANGVTMSAIILTVTVGSSAVPSVTNSASVSSPTFDPIASNNSSSITTNVMWVDLQKSVSGSPTPGTDLTYTVVFTNKGGASVNFSSLNDPNPLSGLKINTNMYFKVGSLSSNLTATGLSLSSVKYSNDGGATWTYTPASGAGSAPAGYDGNVTNVQWNFTGSLSQTAPNNTGSVSFVAQIK